MSKSERKSWEMYQMEFDTLENIDEIFNFLSRVIDELKVCINNKCEIFPKLSKLNKKRSSLKDFNELIGIKTEIVSLTIAKSKIKNRALLKRYGIMYNEYLKIAKSVYSHIFALKVSKESKIDEINDSHDKYMEILDKFNKNNNAYPIDFVKSTQNYVNKYEDYITLKDSKLVENSKNKLKKELNDGK
jgi:hypothetical protein